MSVLTIFIQKAIVQGICILYGALGEIMTEKSVMISPSADRKIGQPEPWYPGNHVHGRYRRTDGSLPL